MEGGGQKRGEKWDKYNSIISKIYLERRKHLLLPAGSAPKEAFPACQANLDLQRANCGHQAGFSSSVAPPVSSDLRVATP